MSTSSAVRVVCVALGAVFRHTTRCFVAPRHMFTNCLKEYYTGYRAALRRVFYFLDDRTNGRAYATVFRLSCRLSSSVCLSVTLCIVAKRCVLEQKLLLRVYRKSYMRNRLVPK